LLHDSEEYALDLIQAHPTLKKGGPKLRLERKNIISMSGAVGISFSDTTDFQIVPILVTGSKNIWSKPGRFDIESHQFHFNPNTDKKLEKTPVAIALTREQKDKTQKIMVFGDADFMSNG